jgi:DNA-binding SARP family transcriptional activator
VFIKEKKDLDLAICKESLLKEFEEVLGQKKQLLEAQSPFMVDLLSVLQSTLSNARSGFAVLEQVSAKGYSQKELLVITCAYLHFVLYFWPEYRFCCEGVEGAKYEPSNRQSNKDIEFLKALENHLAYLLAKQARCLPPNLFELIAFSQAKKLFGERAYVIVSDKVLYRMKTKQPELIKQSKQWKMFLSKASDSANLDLQPRKNPTIQKKIRINTFGRFEIKAYDSSITIQSKVRKQLRLIISLMAMNSGREVAKPWVQHIMWPDASEHNAKQNLYTTWSLLNKSIVDAEGNCPFFESYAETIMINSQLVETDTQLLSDICKQLRNGHFKTIEYEKALASLEELYRGPLLPGEDTAEVVARRKNFKDQLLEALLVSGEYLRKEGQTALAQRYFRFAFNVDPTREDVCYLLMTSLWKMGRHGEALNEYFICRRALIDEFGVEGSPSLQKLYDTILADLS